MMLAARGAFLAARRGPALPYDAEVEYLESTGTQWIDTGIIPLSPDTLSFEARVKYGNTSTRTIMGRQGGFYFGPCNGRLQPGLGSTGTVNVVLTANQWYECAFTFNVPANWVRNGSVDYRVGNTTGRVDTSNPSGAHFFLNDPANGPVWLFVANNATTLRGGCYISFFRILRNRSVVRDYQPVRFTNELDQSEGAMYDRVSGQLFRNSGTGVFTIGPDKMA